MRILVQKEACDRCWHPAAHFTSLTSFIAPTTRAQSDRPIDRPPPTNYIPSHPSHPHPIPSHPHPTQSCPRISSFRWVQATRDLYWAIGDGGKQQDPDGRGGDLSNILASIVRVGIPLPDLDDPSSDDDDFDLTPSGNMKLGSTTTCENALVWCYFNETVDRTRTARCRCRRDYDPIPPCFWGVCHCGLKRDGWDTCCIYVCTYIPMQCFRVSRSITSKDGPTPDWPAICPPRHFFLPKNVVVAARMIWTHIRMFRGGHLLKYESCERTSRPGQ